MPSKIWILPYVLLCAIVLSLSACGGGSTSVSGDRDSEVDLNPHPHFEWRLVAHSPSSSYSPSGDIVSTSPVFSWKPIQNATNYRIRYEDLTSNGSRGKEYELSVSEAKCDNSNQTCSFKISDSVFSIGNQNAWWVRAKIAGKWQDWSLPIVFSIVEQGQTSRVQTLAPTGDITIQDPIFSWQVRLGASKYRLAYESTQSRDWQEITLSAAEVCAGQTCSFQPLDLSLQVGDQKNWWVQAKVDDHWGNWSKPLTFKRVEARDNVDSHNRSQTITFTPLTNASFNYLQNPIHTLHASSSSGLPIQFSVKTLDTCGLRNGIDVFPKKSGICTIVASQAGNNSFLAATPVKQSFFIEKSSQFYSGVERINGPANSAEVGDDIQLRLIADQNAYGTSFPVNFLSISPAVCTVNDQLIRAVNPGVCKVRVSKAGDERYKPYETFYEITISLGDLLITNIVVDGITQTSATIKWGLNHPANGQIEYGESLDFGSSSEGEGNYLNNHSQTLTDLKPDTLYHYRLISMDASGNTVFSENQEFRTLPTIKILALGDSITHGSGYNPPYSSYRDELYDLLTQANYRFEYVGSYSSMYTLADGTSVSLRHEGHPGWRADQISASLSAWLNNYDVDIALLHAGTNDILHAQGSDSDTLQDLENIIRILQAKNPEISILVAKIIPVYDPDQALGLNSLITPVWATLLSTQTSQVKIVDQNSGFLSSYWSSNIIHPNAAGEQFMAQNWFNALKTVIH